MYSVFYNRNAAKCIKSDLFRDEDNDGIIRQYNAVEKVTEYTLRLSMDLQFFAPNDEGGEKTEEPTQKKLDDARDEGQVAKSKEIANGLGLLALFLLLKIWIGRMGIQFIESFSMVYDKIPEVCRLFGGTAPDGDLTVVLRSVMVRLLIILLPIFAVGVVVAFVSDLIQVKWHPTAKPLKPKGSKLNPINGFKRIFSAQSLVELFKSVAKIALIGYVSYSYVVDKTYILFSLYDMTMMQAVQAIGNTVIDLGIRISAVYMILAAADFGYQKFKFNKDMKMSKQEIKDEYKQSEGDPEIKGKIKQRMREASQRRMMQSVPSADVVITNPTHYAVAVKYDPELAEAPVVTAKGADFVAQKIKEIARENDVMIVENKPLARMLYANVDIDQMVPPELYYAVADVLAYVYHTEGRVKSS